MDRGETRIDIRIRRAGRKYDLALIVDRHEAEQFNLDPTPPPFDHPRELFEYKRRMDTRRQHTDTLGQRISFAIQEALKRDDAEIYE